MDVHRLAKEMTSTGDQGKRIVTPRGSEWRKQMDNSQQIYQDKDQSHLPQPTKPEKETLKTKIKNLKNEIFSKEDKDSNKSK